MSYVTPLVLRDYFGNLATAGLVMGFSSVVGLAADWLVAQKLPNTTYRTFIKWLLIISIWFPLVFWIFPGSAVGYLLAMTAWGLYYEMIGFASFDFVDRSVSHKLHAVTWGVLDAFKAMALLIAPVLAGMLFQTQPNAIYMISLFCLSITTLIFFLGEKNRSKKTWSLKSNPTRTLGEEKKIWWELLRKIWPVYLFFFALIMLDAAFWTVGPLLSEQIRLTSQLGSLILPAYILPTLLVPFLIMRFGDFLGKTKTVFATAMVGSIILGVGAMLVGVDAMIVPVILVSSLFIAIDFPEVGALFEGYFGRVGEFGNDLTGLRNSAFSLAYVIGPILAGFLAESLNYSQILIVFAVLLFITGGIALVATPENIRMPKARLLSIISFKNRRKVKKRRLF